MNHLKPLNYKAIVKSLCELYSEKFNEWECEFMKSMLLKDDFTSVMQEKIIQINKKYRSQR
jgi:hypothetical protein